jgi:hypothetical protein
MLEKKEQILGGCMLIKIRQSTFIRNKKNKEDETILLKYID